MLLILLEQDLISQHDIENKVCPVLLALSAPDSDDEYKAEAVNVSLSRERQPHTLMDCPRTWGVHDLRYYVCSVLASTSP